MKREYIYIGAIVALGGLLYWKFGMKSKQKEAGLNSVKEPTKKPKVPKGSGIITRDKPQTIDAPEIPDTTGTGQPNNTNTTLVAVSDPDGGIRMLVPPIRTVPTRTKKPVSIGLSATQTSGGGNAEYQAPDDTNAFGLDDTVNTRTRTIDNTRIGLNF